MNKSEYNRMVKHSEDWARAHPIEYAQNVKKAKEEYDAFIASVPGIMRVAAMHGSFEEMKQVDWVGPLE